MNHRFLIATVLVATMVFACPPPSSAQAPLSRVLIDRSTSDPAAGICVLGNFDNALVAITVDDGGAHSVTFETRACANCPFVEETSLATTVSPGTPVQVRFAGWYQAIKISVANGGGDVVNAWCSTY